MYMFAYIYNVFYIYRHTYTNIILYCFIQYIYIYYMYIFVYQHEDSITSISHVYDILVNSRKHTKRPTNIGQKQTTHGAGGLAGGPGLAPWEIV